MNNQQEKNSREKRWLWLWRIENCKLTIKILFYLSLQASETKGTVRLVRGHRNKGPHLTDITLQSAPDLILSTLRRVDRREPTSTVTLSTLIPTNHGEYLQPATKLRQGNVFTPVCHSVHRGGWVSVPACTTGHMTGGGVLSGGSLTAGLCLGGLCPGRSLFRGLCPVHLCPVGSLSRRVSIWRGICPGGSPSGGSLLGRPLHMVMGGRHASYWNWFLFLSWAYFPERLHTYLSIILGGVWSLIQSKVYIG